MEKKILHSISNFSNLHKQITVTAIELIDHLNDGALVVGKEVVIKSELNHHIATHRILRHQVTLRQMKSLSWMMSNDVGRALEFNELN